MPKAVITGSGILAANGIGSGAFWSSCAEGRSGITRIPGPGAGHLVGAVSGFDPAAALGLEARKAARHSRIAQLAFAAAREAMAAAGEGAVEPAPRDQDWNVLIGVSLGGLDVFERELRGMLEGGRGRMSPTVMSCVNLAPAALIRDGLGLRARVGTVSNTCVGGLDAIARAAADLRAGVGERALAGGADAPLAPGILAGFGAAGLLSRYEGPPGTASRPFDLLAGGGVLAEGAAVVVLESLQAARFRGARILAEVAGSGTASDPPSSAPGSGLEASMRLALADASVLPSDLAYLCAHAPGDRQIDRAEAEAVARVLGRHAARLPVSSIKGVCGSPLAAAGAMQVAACLEVFRHGRIPPTANLDHPVPGLGLDLVRGEARRARVPLLLINAHGMGGVNTSLILRAPGGE